MHQQRKFPVRRSDINRNVKNTDFVPETQINLISVESFACFIYPIMRKTQTNLN